MKWHERDSMRWLEPELPGVRAVFTTRIGGASAAPFESLNLAIKTGDDPGDVRANRLKLAAALEIDPSRVAMARQVHGASLIEQPEPPALQVFGECLRSLVEADAHASAVPGQPMFVITADCLPVAFAGPGGAAIAHAGWRGIAAGVLERSAEAVGATHAAIGPGIGKCCFEVGEEVLEEFADLDGIADGRMLDLAGAAEQRLGAAGVSDVEIAGLCTHCEADLFFSHRREGPRTGRQAGLAWVDG